MKLADDLLITPEGLARLREELAELQSQRQSKLEEYWENRRQAEEGDKTADYQPSDVSYLSTRIAEIEQALLRAVVVEPSDRERGRVGVGSRVKVRWEDGEEETYVVVGPLEVEPSSGRISYESPVGSALLGKASGDWVEVAAPGGAQRLEVLAVR